MKPAFVSRFLALLSVVFICLGMGGCGKSGGGSGSSGNAMTGSWLCDSITNPNAINFKGLEFRDDGTVIMSPMFGDRDPQLLHYQVLDAGRIVITFQDGSTQIFQMTKSADELVLSYEDNKMTFKPLEAGKTMAQAIAEQIKARLQNAAAANPNAQPSAPSSESAPDTARKAAASGQWDTALLAARNMLWNDPGNSEAIGIIQNAVYQKGLRQAQDGLASGQLDSAFDGAMTAYIHQPSSKDAADLLKKIQDAISQSPTYLGKWSSIPKAFPISTQSEFSYWPSGGNKIMFYSGAQVLNMDFDSGSATGFRPDNVDVMNILYAPKTGNFLEYRDELNTPVIQLLNGNGATLWSINGQYALGFSPDGTTVASCDGNGVDLIDVSSGKDPGSQIEVDLKNTVNQFRVGQAKFPNLFSPDGKFLALVTLGGGPNDANWTIIDLTTRAIVKQFPTSPGGFYQFYGAFGPNNQFAYGNDIQTSIVDTTNWLEKQVINATGPLAFSPDGQVLAMGKSLMDTQLYNASTGAPIGNPIRGNVYTFTPDSSVLYVMNLPKLVDYNAKTGQQLGSCDLPNCNGAVRCCVMTNPAGNPIVGYGQTLGMVKTTPLSNATDLKSFPPHAYALPSMQPDGSQKLNDAIAQLKSTYGIDLDYIQANSSYPVPVDLKLGQDASQSGDAHANMLRCLHDQELMEGTTGFYVLTCPNDVVWEWYPGANPSLLSSDDVSKLAPDLNALAQSNDLVTTLRQFLADLDRTLKQTHPEIRDLTDSSQSSDASAPPSAQAPAPVQDPASAPYQFRQ